MIGAKVFSSLIKERHIGINFRFPYPTGGHSDDACDWNSPDKHFTTVYQQISNSVVLQRKIDKTVYYVKIEWKGKASFTEKEKNYFVLMPQSNDFSFTCLFQALKLIYF